LALILGAIGLPRLVRSRQPTLRYHSGQATDDPFDTAVPEYIEGQGRRRLTTDDSAMIKGRPAD
jgi:hypothetical protein